MMTIEQADAIIGEPITKEMITRFGLTYDDSQDSDLEDLYFGLDEVLSSVLPRGYETKYVDILDYDNPQSCVMKLDWIGNDEITDWYFIAPNDDWFELYKSYKSIIRHPGIIEVDDCYDRKLNPDMMPCRTWKIDPSGKFTGAQIIYLVKEIIR